MRFQLTLLSLFLGCSFVGGQNAFGPGNLVVLQVGTTGTDLNNRSREFALQEFTTSGTLVQSIAMPTTGTHKITIQGTSSLEGFMSLSSNRAYLVFGGYDLETGIASPSSSGTNAVRVLARVGKNGLVDLSTKVPGADLHSNGALRSVASHDGTTYWTAGGTQGIRYVTHGSNTSVLVSNTVTNGRSIKIFGGQLYLGHSSGASNPRLMAVGSGLPTTEGNTSTGLPGFPTSGAYVDFVFFDRDNTEPDNDVVYIADDGAGIRKFSKVAGTWVENGIFGTSSDGYRGLTGVIENNNVVLYATRKGGTSASGGGELVKVTDAAGYNTAINATDVLLATAPANTAFRGVAFAPTEEVLPLHFTRFTGQVNHQMHLLDWKTEAAYNVAYFTVQLSTNLQQFTAIGRVNAKQNAVESYQFSHQSKLSGKHFYRLQVTDMDGKTYYSPVVALFAQKEAGQMAVFPNPIQNGILTVVHPTAGKLAGLSLIGADGRVLLNQPVQAGSTQTTVNAGNLSRGIYRVVFADEKVKQQKAILKD